MKLILTLLLLTFSLFANIQSTAYQVVHFYSAQVVNFSVARDTYGTLLRHSGSSDNPFLFTGEQYDKETGNYYLRARYYSPELARFLSRDTYDGQANNPISQNHYAYANDNPLRYVDPSGHIGTMLEVISSMNLRVMAAVGRIQTSFAAVGSAGSAFVYLGKIVERQAGTIIQMASRALQYKVAIERGVVQLGPGGRRVIDLLVKGKDAIARIEVKYQLPTRTGSALSRLISQMQTSVSNTGQTVLFTFKEPEIRTLAKIIKELENAGVPSRSIQFVHGYKGLAQWFALYFHP